MTTTTFTRHWNEVPPYGVTGEPGDVGGDRQLTDAWSRRFYAMNEDGTFTVITEYAYVVPSADGRYAAESQTEVIDCRDPLDPGGTEITADYDYQALGYYDYETVEEADAEAHRQIEALSTGYYG